MSTLVERYRPKRIQDFVGLPRVKAMLARLVRRPEPMALLFVGPPGTGKTNMAQALANELNAALIHVASQKMVAESVDRVWEDVHYYPPEGKRWWVVLCDEADQMSRAAQNALLSHLDSTANLAFDFGGATRERPPLPVVWVFTLNGTGERGTGIPPSLEGRFVSRCITVEFDPESIRKVLPQYLRGIWEKEGGGLDFGNGEADEFEELTIQERWGSVRDCLQALERRLLEADYVEERAEEVLVEEPREPEPPPLVLTPEPVRVRPVSLLDMLRESEESFWAGRT